MNSKGMNLPAAALFVLAVLPWLNPHVFGPSSALSPWLFSMLAASVLWAIAGRGAPARVQLLILVTLGTWSMLAAMAVTPEVLGLLAAGISIMAMSSVATASSRDDPVALAAIPASWLAAASVSAVIGICQYFGLAHGFGSLANVSSLGEAFANLRQRNQFASLTAIGMAAVLWWSSSGMKRRHALSAMVLLAAADAASASRTGLAQLIMFIGLSVIWRGPARPVRLVLCLAAAGTYVAAALLLPAGLEALSGVKGESVWDRLVNERGCSSRTVLWSNVLHLVAQKPWLGWGWSELDYAHYMTLYGGPRFCDILDNAHNLPLHLAVEFGAPVALLVCGAACWMVLRARPWRETDATRQLAWSVLGVITLHSMLEYPLWYGPFQIAFGLALGLLGQTATPSAHRSPALSVQRLAALALVGCVAYAMFDYHRVSQLYLAAPDRAVAYREDTVSKVEGSWLFRNPVRFAALTTTPLTRANAQWTYDTALALLHYSPEPRVIEKVIESAVMLGRDDEALAHLRRYQAAFPREHGDWIAKVRPRNPRGAAD